jgi:hypothetical protein
MRYPMQRRSPLVGIYIRAGLHICLFNSIINIYAGVALYSKRDMLDRGPRGEKR